MPRKSPFRAGYGSVTFDVQHGGFDYEGVLIGVAAAASTGTPALVRVGLNDHGFAARCVDAGAAGLLVPMVNTAGDAQQLVGAVRYPPVGQRSWGPNHALQQTGLAAQECLPQANAGTFLFAMIETREALSHMDAIAALEGIDGLFIGPLDLAISLSQGTSCDPDSDAVTSAMEQVAQCCKRHGKVAGAYAASPALAARYAFFGYRFLAIALDLVLLDRSARTTLDAARQAIA